MERGRENNMPDKPDLQKPPQVQINVGDEILRGRYSNNIMMAHSPEEFILDWLLIHPVEFIWYRE